VFIYIKEIKIKIFILSIYLLDRDVDKNDRVFLIF